MFSPSFPLWKEKLPQVLLLLITGVHVDSTRQPIVVTSDASRILYDLAVQHCQGFEPDGGLFCFVLFFSLQHQGASINVVFDYFVIFYN